MSEKESRLIGKDYSARKSLPHLEVIVPDHVWVENPTQEKERRKREKEIAAALLPYVGSTNMAVKVGVVFWTNDGNNYGPLKRTTGTIIGKVLGLLDRHEHPTRRIARVRCVEIETHPDWVEGEAPFFFLDSHYYFGPTKTRGLRIGLLSNVSPVRIIPTPPPRSIEYARRRSG